MATKSKTPSEPQPKKNTGENGQFVPGNDAASKYKDEYADWMRAYVDGGYDIIPTLAEFCVNHDLPERTVTRWVTEKADNYERLATQYARLLSKQKAILIKFGLTEQFNSHIVKFLLANNHGMSDKASTTVDAKTDNKFEVNIKVVD